MPQEANKYVRPSDKIFVCQFLATKSFVLLRVFSLKNGSLTLPFFLVELPRQAVAREVGFERVEGWPQLGADAGREARRVNSVVQELQDARAPRGQIEKECARHQGDGARQPGMPPRRASRRDALTTYMNDASTRIEQQFERNRWRYLGTRRPATAPWRLEPPTTSPRSTRRRPGASSCSVCRYS